MRGLMWAILGGSCGSQLTVVQDRAYRQFPPVSSGSRIAPRSLFWYRATARR
jgi:hypothetical protein